MGRQLLVLFLCLGISITHGCTTLFVGRRASKTGEVLIAHSSDGGAQTDPRIVHVGARDHSSGSARPVFAAPEDYPRYVGYERQIPDYFPVDGQTPFKAIGSIPQVSHTMSYFEETYAIANEAGVGFAETTCSAIIGAYPAPKGKAILSIDALSRIAAERAKTAREAVMLMGSLAEEYWFYGPWSFEGSGETLIVADAMEGYVFHILSDDTGASAIWVAQRVPDDHVTVVANMFTVRDVNVSDSQNFLFSKNLLSVAEKKGWWSPSSGKPLDFTYVYSDGEYAHKYYSGRRMWRALSLAAPSLNLNASYGDIRLDKPYPFSVAPDELLTIEDVQRIMRDDYQNTSFDMTAGLAAGPFGVPDRWEGGEGEKQVTGNWERSIGLFRTSDSYIVQFRSWLPPAVGTVAWYGPHAAPGTVYVPFPVGMTSLPVSHTHGVQAKYDSKSAFWAHRYVFNLAHMKYNYVMKDIRQEQTSLEAAGTALLKQAEAMWVNGSLSQSQLTDVFSEFATNVTDHWWQLRDSLMFKYADGWINTPSLGQAVGYPAWWLKDVGYANGPPPPPGPGPHSDVQMRQEMQRLKPGESLLYMREDQRDIMLG